MRRSIMSAAAAAPFYAATPWGGPGAAALPRSPPCWRSSPRSSRRRGTSTGLKKGNAMVSESQFAFLRSIDTPTVCNLIEIVAPARRGAGYTVQHLHCPFPDLPPMVGFAKTVTMRARDAVGGPSYMQKRMDYLDYVAGAPQPGIAVIEDKD